MAESAPNAGRPASRACTVAGLATVAAGIACFLLGGGGAHIAWLADRFAELSGFGHALVVAATVAAVAACCAALHGPRAATMVLVAAAALFLSAVLAGILTMVAFGWTRLVGISLAETYPAIGSPLTGLGGLAVAVGLVALVWCLAPVMPEGSLDGNGVGRGPNDRKAVAATVAAMIFLGLPGFAASDAWRSPTHRAVPSSVAPEAPSHHG